MVEATGISIPVAVDDYVVRPEEHGAVGDGVADDTAALQAACDAAVSAGQWLVGTSGSVYGITGSIEWPIGLKFDGRGSTVKLIVAVPDFERMFTTSNTAGAYPTLTEDTLGGCIRDVTLDGNKSIQGAYQGFELEHHACLFFSSSFDSEFRLKFLVEDMTIKHSAGDGIAIRRNCDVIVRNVQDIGCWRGGLVLTAGYSSLTVDGYKATSSGDTTPTIVQIELSGSSSGFGGSDQIDVDIKNMQVDSLQLEVRESALVSLQHVVVRKYFWTIGATDYAGGEYGILTATNCVFQTTDDTQRNEIRNLCHATFKDCIFRLIDDNGATHPSALRLNQYSGEGVHGDLLFDHCHFTAATGLANLAASDAAACYISPKGAVRNFDVLFRQCTFGGGFSYGIYDNRGGRVAIDRCRFDGLVSAGVRLYLAFDGTYANEFEVIGPQHLEDITNQKLLSFTAGTALTPVTFTGHALDAADNVIRVLGSSAIPGRLKVPSGRIIFGTAPPTPSDHGLLGDRWVWQDGVDHREWVNYKGSITAADWREVGGSVVLPTSATGLPSGSIYNDGGVITLVP